MDRIFGWTDKIRQQPDAVLTYALIAIGVALILFALFGTHSHKANVAAWVMIP